MKIVFKGADLIPSPNQEMFGGNPLIVIEL